MNGSEYGNSVDVPDEVDPRAERVLTQAGAAARRAGAEDFIGVEHIFLAILADEDAIPTQVMWIGRPGERSGRTHHDARVRRVLEQGHTSSPARPGRGAAAHPSAMTLAGERCSLLPARGSPSRTPPPPTLTGRRSHPVIQPRNVETPGLCSEPRLKAWASGGSKGGESGLQALRVHLEHLDRAGEA
jgi:hypothetical protein